MTRLHAPAVLAAVLWLASAATAQQPAVSTLAAPRVIGPGGPGMQQQVNTSPYQPYSGAPTSRGVNPFAAQGCYGFPTTYPPGTRVAARPVVLAPLPAPGAAPNNPGAFNPGFPAPVPVLVPQVPGLVNPVAFNPVLVSRPGVASAYYVSPLTTRQTGESRYTSPDGRVTPGPGVVHNPVTDSAETGTPFDPSSGFVVRPGEFRYLPWVW